MTQLLIYNSGGDASNLKAAADIFYAYPGITVKDVNGLNTNQIGTYCSTTLVDGTYDEIFICCVTQSSGANNLLTFDQVASLRPKMKTGKTGTVVDSGTCQANATVTDIILATTASSDDDTYNGMYIQTFGTTEVLRSISDYTGSSRTAVTTTTTTAITTTETYEVYTNDYIYELGNVNTTTGKTPVLQAWDVIFPDVTYPAINAYIGGYKFAMNSGTAQSVAAGTIQLAASVSAGDIMTQTEHDADDTYNGMYVYIYSATTGAAQYALISNYVGSTTTCTLSANWGITPTGTVVYRIVGTIDEVLYDRAAEVMVKTYMYTCNAAAVREINQKLIDNDSNLKVLGITETGQDLDYLWNDFLYRGKAIFLADALAVV